MSTFTIGECNQKDILLRFFLISIFFLFCIFIICFSYNPMGEQSNVFFMQTEDIFADYYNVAKFSADRNPYFSEFKGSYLPISYVISNVLSRFAPYSQFNAIDAWKTSMGLVSSMLFMFFISVVFFLLLLFFSNVNKPTSYLIIISLMISGIFLFSFERGNLIILSALLATIFLFNYNSNNKFLKEFAFLCLAFSASIKGFPALLGLLLIYEKRFSEAIRLMVYGVLVAFLPFLLMKGGFTNIPQFLKNLRFADDLYLYKFYPRFGYYYFVAAWNETDILRNLISKEILNNIFSIVMYIVTVFGIVLNFYEKQKWKQISLLTCIIILIPTNSAIYCGLYLFPVIIMFFNQPVLYKKDWLYVILFIVFLNPLQISIWGKNLNVLLINFAVMTLAFDIFFSHCRNWLAHFKEKRLYEIMDGRHENIDNVEISD